MKKPEKNDSIDSDVEEHVPVLLKTISNLKLEKIDLTSEESAKEASLMLNEALEKLNTLKNTSAALRRILEKN